ncbi:MAG: 4Fe-4S binding protein [Gallionellaceae bacterium]|nr:4Fe-4S binding protein [Gallionellaceae bacterium]
MSGSNFSSPARGAARGEGATVAWTNPCSLTPALPQGGREQTLARLGLWLRRQRGLVLGLQWAVVLFYAVVVAVPAFLPLPGEADHILDNLTRFAQFLFWGLWWPFVIVSVMTLGRTWCGLFCPEGALSEFAARWSLNRHIPAWLKWAGWPFVAFVLTTVFGQMTSVYEYPKPALLILGGSTVAAVVVGLLYGRNKRVWCRYLCPVTGVFGLLAKLAPVHFAVDRVAWDGPHMKSQPVNCAPLVDIRRMQSASNCHMCGRCAGQRGAVALAWRSPEKEILSLYPLSAGPSPAVGGGEQEVWSARLLVFGMLGVALGAFQWSASPWFVAAKQRAAEWLIEREIWWPLDAAGHWWLFTDYPELNDAFTWLDGGMLLAYIGATTLVSGGWIWLCLRAAAALSGTHWTRLAMALIPFAGASVFVGLSLLTTGQLFSEGIVLAWAHPVRLALLGLAAFWTVTLAWRLARWPAGAGVGLAAALPLLAWQQQFYLW